MTVSVLSTSKQLFQHTVRIHNILQPVLATAVVTVDNLHQHHVTVIP